MPSRLRHTVWMLIADLRLLGRLRRVCWFGRAVLAWILAGTLTAAGASLGMAATGAPSTAPTALAQHQHPCGSGSPIQAPAPAKPLPSGCVSDLGCVLVIGIPVPSTALTQDVSWTPVHYWPRSEIARGITSQPILGPPIGSI